jgi:hypothetical protein
MDYLLAAIACMLLLPVQLFLYSDLCELLIRSMTHYVRSADAFRFFAAVVCNTYAHTAANCGMHTAAANNGMHTCSWPKVASASNANSVQTDSNSKDKHMHVKLVVRYSHMYNKCNVCYKVAASAMLLAMSRTAVTQLSQHTTTQR